MKINGRCISKGRCLIADVLQTTNMPKLNGMLITIDIQKAVDSVYHQFLILALKRYGFGKTFIKWVKTLLNNQESCIINGRFTTKYFKLDKGTRQGDPISAYLFVLVLEIVFNLIKQNKDMHGLTFFDHTLTMNVFYTFSIYSGLKPNKSKCEIAGIGILKGMYRFNKKLSENLRYSFFL